MRRLGEMLRIVGKDTSKVKKLGLVADIQYADVENGSDFHNTEVRRYREALNVARKAGERFREYNVDMVCQLGDIVDGKAGKHIKQYCEEKIFPALEVKKGKNCVERIDLIGSFIPFTNRFLWNMGSPFHRSPVTLDTR